MNNKKQTSAHAALKNLLIVPVAAMIFAAFSCDNNAIRTNDSAYGQASTKKLTQNGEEVFAKVDQMPVFPGGERAMMEFISKEIKYPESAKATGVQGTVIIQMIIDKEGKVQDAKVVKGVPALDAEALRVINSMPVWAPGKQGGRTVAVACTIPFRFKLN